MFPRANRSIALAFIVVSFLSSRLLEAQPPATPSASKPASVITMSVALQLAIEHNQSMRAQRLNVDQSKANEITAALKPNPVYTTTNEDFPIFNPNQLIADNLRNNQEFLQSISYTFERGGKRQKRITVAQDTTDVVSKSVADFERQLKFQVAQAFVNVLLAKSSLEFSKDDLKDFSEVVSINKSRLDAGDISEADYLKIALQKLQLEQDVSAAELGLEQSKAVLRQLVGFETVAEDYDVLGELGHKKYVIGPDEIARQALLQRPDFLAAQSAVKLADDTVALAYGNRARDLTGEWEYKRNGPVNGVGFGFSIDLPVHDRNQGEIARSKVAARQAGESQSAARASVLTDVVNAYSGFKANDRIVSLYESGYLEQATQSRQISNYAYRKGATSLLDLLDAERSYRAVQLAYRQALSAYMLSAEQINLVVGKQVLQ
jgi:cobalt-zinc-cadmium efflux system outer membrane protein